jgi:hypothetical protein
MWAWGGFRVVLNRKSRLVFQPNSCNGIIIQVNMRDFHITFLNIFSYDIESMVLGSDFTFSRE